MDWRGNLIHNTHSSIPSTNYFLFTLVVSDWRLLVPLSLIWDWSRCQAKCNVHTYNVYFKADGILIDHWSVSRCNLVYPITLFACFSFIIGYNDVPLIYLPGDAIHLVSPIRCSLPSMTTCPYCPVSEVSWKTFPIAVFIADSATLFLFADIFQRSRGPRPRSSDPCSENTCPLSECIWGTSSRYRVWIFMIMSD